MSDSDGIRVDFDGIAEEARKGGEVQIEFTPDRPAGRELFDAMSQALEAANEALSSDDFGSGLISTVAGCGTTLRYPSTEQALRDWLRVFTRRLWAEGWGGSLQLTPAVFPPPWLRTLRQPILTVFASYDVAAGDVVGLRLCEAVTAWARSHGGPDEYLVNSGLTMPDRTGDLSLHVRRALSHGSLSSAICTSAQPGPMSRISFAADGRAAHQVYAPETTPMDLVGAVRELLLVDCEATRWAAVAATTRPSHAWTTLNKVRGQPSPQAGWVAGFNNPAWSMHVPDAFGMQLLTSEHLSRVTDLSGWSVTEVAPGRHLVEAPDLGDWTSFDGPQPDTLAAARTDFGRAIDPTELTTR